ncbi:MAG: hypothetical protein ACUZ77_03580 [Candidatus Brocadiales bacterium]
MLTGSVASSLQGEPRATHDIDVVVAIQKPVVKNLVMAFPQPDFYLDEDSVVDAIDRQRMFNLIDVKEGGKVDFWILTDEPFDQSRFSRKYVEEVMGIRIQVSSPEDTILAKLRWAKLSGGSEKQFTDALRVYEVQFGKLDMNYLEYWVKELDIEPMWKRLIDEAETA